jgi:hypothetical protein
MFCLTFFFSITYNGLGLTEGGGLFSTNVYSDYQTFGYHKTVCGARNCHSLALQRYNKKMKIRNDFQKKEKIISGLFLSVLWSTPLCNCYSPLHIYL